jgi:ABC-type lipoprotein release transport system permease subunit
MATIKASSMNIHEGDSVDVFFLNTTQPAPNTKTNAVIKVSNVAGKIVIELYDEKTAISIQPYSGSTV